MSNDGHSSILHLEKRNSNEKKENEIGFPGWCLFATSFDQMKTQFILIF